ncbi:MAG: CDP-glycerol glycerophosphotransferase family protein [Bacilli bacterium]|nr:CDP-glycerol glycerophosphotransferase family protein [Bacilli bacterium]
MKTLIIFFKLHLKVVYFFIKLIPVNKNKITFLSRQSNNKNLDFKLLEKELLITKPNLKILILCKKFNNKKKHIFSYYFHIYRQMYHIATSKVCIVDSYIIPISILKHKKSLTVIQIWHAMGAIKQFGYQTIAKQAGDKKNQVIGVKTKNIDKLMCMHKNYDLIISGSKEMVKYFSQAFNATPNQFMIESLPRIDYLINEFENIRNRIYSKHPNLKEKKTILYAPTFRKNKNKVEKLIKSINLEKYNLIIKGHPNKNIQINKENIYICDDFSALELLTVTDYLITDYSAISIEASVLNIPIYFYLYDYQDYIKYNGVNIDLYKEMPGVCFDNIKDILNHIDNNKYNLDIVTNFRNKYVTNYSGNATKNISDYIINNCL